MQISAIRQLTGRILSNSYASFKLFANYYKFLCICQEHDVLIVTACHLNMLDFFFPNAITVRARSMHNVQTAIRRCSVGFSQYVRHIFNWRTDQYMLRSLCYYLAYK